MKTVLVLAGMALCATIYLYWVRPYLKSLPSLAEHYAREESLFAAFKLWLYGRRTILIGIWGELIAMGPDMLQAVSGIDLKAILGLPDMWAAIITGIIPILMIIFRTKASPPDAEEN